MELCEEIIAYFLSATVLVYMYVKASRKILVRIRHEVNETKKFESSMLVLMNGKIMKYAVEMGSSGFF